MKPLILMLLFAISASAQSITDLARHERERKANTTPTRVLNADTAREPMNAAPAETKPGETKTSAPKAAEAKPAAAAEPARPAGPEKPAATPASTPTPNEEALRKYTEELSYARAHVIELQDRQTALQLQQQDLKNAYLAPVTDPDTRAHAETQMTDVQTQIAETQRELAEALRQVQVLEAQGPPKPE
jgi:hypothetical protein